MKKKKILMYFCLFILASFGMMCITSKVVYADPFASEAKMPSSFNGPITVHTASEVDQYITYGNPEVELFSSNGKDYSLGTIGSSSDKFLKSGSKYANWDACVGGIIQLYDTTLRGMNVTHSGNIGKGAEYVAAQLAITKFASESTIKAYLTTYNKLKSKGYTKEEIANNPNLFYETNSSTPANIGSTATSKYVVRCVEAYAKASGIRFSSLMDDYAKDGYIEVESVVVKDEKIVKIPLDRRFGSEGTDEKNALAAQEWNDGSLLQVIVKNLDTGKEVIRSNYNNGGYKLSSNSINYAYISRIQANEGDTKYHDYQVGICYSASSSSSACRAALNQWEDEGKSFEDLEPGNYEVTATLGGYVALYKTSLYHTSSDSNKEFVPRLYYYESKGNNNAEIDKAVFKTTFTISKDDFADIQNSSANIKVVKADKKTDFVSGVKIVIKDEAGKKVYEDESENKTIKVPDLEVGKYIVEVISVPNGYTLPKEPIEFEIDYDNEIANVEILISTKVNVPDTLSNVSKIFICAGIVGIIAGVYLVYSNAKKQEQV